MEPAVFRRSEEDDPASFPQIAHHRVGGAGAGTDVQGRSPPRGRCRREAAVSQRTTALVQASPQEAVMVTLTCPPVVFRLVMVPSLVTGATVGTLLVQTTVPAAPSGESVGVK